MQNLGCNAESDHAELGPASPLFLQVMVRIFDIRPPNITTLTITV